MNGLVQAWPERTILFHRVAAGLVGGAAALLAALIGGAPWWGGLGLAGGAIYYVAVTRRFRRRRNLLARPFDAAWRTILRERVPFYRALDGEAEKRFEDDVRIFLAEQVISGAANLEVDDTTRVLVAASAAMLSNGLPAWEWPRVRDIIVYPRAFDERYDVREGRDVADQVHLHSPIIFSARDLKLGFRHKDGHNVGLHELAHVIDMEDGSADGIPVDAPIAATAPFIEVVAKRLTRIRRGAPSPLRAYAGTNEAEVFAVAVEVFFEKPHDLARRDPELFALLRTYFNQDPRHPGKPLCVQEPS